MSKLFVFDLDGTLLNSNGEILPESIEAMKKAKSQGHYLSIATGRGLISIQKILEQYNGFDFAVCNNGVLVKNFNTEKVIVNSSLDPELITTLWEEAKATESPFTISTDKNVYTLKPNSKFEWLKNQDEMDFKIGEMSTIEKVKSNVLNGEKLTQLALRNSEETISQIYNKYLNSIGKENSTFLTNRVFYDVNPLGSDKVVGVKTVAEELKISKDNIVIFGDSGNDIKMVDYAKYGFAMSNGTDEIKKVAYETIGDHNEPAIAKTILKFL